MSDIDGTRMPTYINVPTLEKMLIKFKLNDNIINTA